MLWCSFSAGSALLLDRHQRVEHPFGQRHSETFECELCGVQATSRETYQSHLLGRPHAVKERAVMSLQALRRMEETVRPNSERADLARSEGVFPPPALMTAMLQEGSKGRPLIYMPWHPCIPMAAAPKLRRGSVRKM